ncbi:MAG: Protein translocase subunit SecF [Candidatus Wolfebacteria bacterium GW2011_GWA2_42_10]|uniref:Protein-export membrane protein SecF n=2 Tax=Candidatus Wolfeibacteriota TaxID=1752735 RepID=A0A0G0XJL7_9BACT|nr:MAG: Protein translocase subunit SecF [Candidatus Wolfebacteria bacterium GW2011_GWB1_41_12]KKS25100.1 MAG: Protein translocase subunit SecF [Candidatus Wolfebacteria bacterium GW2011_GWA2_42_10]KKT56333.1 MAG: Protein translocase subunit SecF [Candidatus Wolfebacteria bacterium GW2011_GWA1_44_24]
MNIIAKKHIFLLISGTLIAASIGAIAVFGLKPGIDFTGGTLWQIKSTTDNRQLTTDNLRDFFEKDLMVKNFIVYSQETNQSFLIRLGHLSEEEHQKYFESLEIKFNGIEELRYEAIGPAIGKELRNKAFLAIIFVLLGISLYVAYAFRKVSYPIKSWKYGIITLLTLFHDVLIAAGFLAFLGYRLGIELDTKFIVAMLVVMGFSVHDTIVVFDRIRENLLKESGRFDLSAIINDSINQTIARSINTSLTLVLVLLALFFFGPFSLKYFVLVIMVGTIVGTYSSIFIASPALLIAKKK